MKERNKPYTGIRSLIRENGITINQLYQEMSSNTDVHLSQSAFYNFCRGESFTRQVEMINWVAGRLGVTSEALLGFYIVSGTTRVEKEAKKPKNIQKNKIKSSTKEIEGEW